MRLEGPLGGGGRCEITVRGAMCEGSPGSVRAVGDVRV